MLRVIKYSLSLSRSRSLKIIHYCLWRMASLTPDLYGYLPSLSWYSVRLPMEWWPGWVNVGDWVHTEIVYLPTIRSPWYNHVTQSIYRPELALCWDWDWESPQLSSNDTLPGTLSTSSCSSTVGEYSDSDKSSTSSISSDVVLQESAVR